MILGTQVKLMRVLQEKCLQRLGDKETISVDVRVVAATHRDLETAIQQKQFREDLYYRLSVVVITLPPLRNRKEGIPDLIRYFLQKHGLELGNANPSIHPSGSDRIYPGAKLARKRARIGKCGAQIRATINLDHVRLALNKNGGLSYSSARSLGEYVDELLAAARRDEISDAHSHIIEMVERELFARSIRQAQGNQAKAARWLGVSRISMKAKLVQFGLHLGSGADQER